MPGPERRDEFRLIADLFAPLAAGLPAGLDLLDDAACLPCPAGKELILTADAMVEGVHFLAQDPPSTVARKILRVNLSDLAAMGAEAVGYLLTTAWPDRVDDAWIADFVDGLANDQKRFGCHLLGGDTVSTSGPLTLSLTAVGRVPQGGALRRAGAAEGDCLFVSGTIGDAAMGLKVLRGELEDLDQADRSFLTERYRLPNPRLALGLALRGMASAAIDVSDGLAQDLGHLAAASGLGADIEVSRIPLSGPCRAALSALRAEPVALLGGGDDYELLFTAPASRREDLARTADRLDLPIAEIGRMTAAAEIRAIGEDGQEIPIPTKGWQHR